MNFKPLLLLPPLVIAGLLFVQMNRTSETPPEPRAPEGVAVRIAAVTSEPLVATAVGYGRVEPVRAWNAVAEVQGRILSIVPELAVGSIVNAGDTLFEIDVTDYELARQKALANIASTEAQLQELEFQEANTRATLELENQILQVAQAEFDRMQELSSKETVSQAAVDSARKTFLAQTNSVLQLRNTLALFPVQRQSLEATLQVRRADLADAEHAISKTRILSPFRGRVSALNVERDQFVRSGEVLLELHDVTAAEIISEVQPSSFSPMIALAQRARNLEQTIIDTTEAVAFLRSAGVTAEVTLAQSGISASWPAEIVRIRGTMDSETGSLGLVVRVQDPQLSNRESRQPPLNVGTFVEVDFRAPPIEGLLAIPRQAVRYDDTGQPFAFLADDENRLARSKLVLGPIVGDRVIVADGLAEGDRLLLSNPQPPVLGMLLNPVTDTGGQ